MTAKTCVTVLLTGLFLGPFAVQPADAQWSCGPITRTHDGWQMPGKARYQIQVSTERDVAVCPFVAELQTEAWIHGYGASVTRGTWVASLNISAGVPSNQWAYSTGKHWLIINFGAWTAFPNSSARAFIVPPPPKDSELCASMGGEWINGTCRIENTPLIIDTENDGYELTSVRKGVLFDLDADGEKERVAWTSPGGNEAFLAMDRNGNGRIDNGSELFGDRTPMSPNATLPRAANGFQALLTLEKLEYGQSHADGLIDEHDSAFRDLLLWRDRNHDGISQPSELQPVRRTNIAAFETRAKETRRVDEHGNRFRLKGTLYVKRPNGKLKAQGFWDIWLRRDS